jgi:hypothetical protein
MKPKHPTGPAMTLGNMRELGVQRLIASCLNDACRHVALNPIQLHRTSKYIAQPSSETYSTAPRKAAEFRLRGTAPVSSDRPALTYGSPLVSQVRLGLGSRAGDGL